jgi:hypothetical protein
MGNLSFFEILIISLIVFIVVFLILREFICWYYKINKRIENQERANYLLEHIYEKLGGDIVTDSQKVDSKETENENSVYDYVDRMGAPRRGIPKQARENGWSRAVRTTIKE